MQKISLKIKKLFPEAKMPVYASEHAAGADLYALTDHIIRIGPNETAVIHTGLAAEIPEGYVGLICARSGLATKKGLAPANKVGVIDSDYRGELRVPMVNLSDAPYTVQPGERVAQLCIAPVWQAAFVPADTLTDTARGAGGFGSTGTV